MLTAITICLIIVAIFNLGIGLIVLMGGKSEKAHRIFFLLTCSVSLWTLGIALFLLTDNLVFAKTWASIYYVAAALIAYLSLAFALSYPEEDTVHNSILILLLLPVVGVLSIVLNPNGLIEGVSLLAGGGNNTVQLHDGFYALYTVYFVTYLYGAFAVIASKMLKAMKRKNARLHKQLKYMLLGMVLAGTFGTIFNLILPLFNNYRLIWVGPLFSFIYISAIFYAVIRHGLFDIRLAFARIVAYLLLLLTLAVTYGIGIFSISALLFQGSQISTLQNITYAALAIFLAFTFQPLKQFFDRITDRLFFRDDYFLEEVLDRLGDATVTETDIGHIVSSARKILSRALKPSYMVFAIVQKNGHEKVESYVDNSFKRDSKETIRQLVEIIKNTREKEDVIFRKATSDKRLIDFMARYDAGAVVLLKTKHELNGYIILGPKQSGQEYRRKDSQLLNTAADELALAFQNALRFDEIRAFNRTLQGKVDEATAQLRRTNVKLQQLDEAKDEFISMASHQLRTPLTSVKGYLSMVLEGDAGKLTGAQKKLIEEAYGGSQRMVYLIGDFLNVSRMKTGKFMLEYADSDLAKLISDELDQLRDTAARRQIKLVYQEPEDIPIARFDENKIRQVIMNLTDNAIYYSKPESTINIELYKKDGQLVFKVKDQGIGVPAKEQKDLFEKFYRATNARKVRPDGTGIGLFMIKKVIIAHGGNVIFESTEGKGSTFGFTLPIKAKGPRIKVVSESLQPKDK